MKYAFYPGCTQESTAEEFGLSSEAVCKALGIELEEIPDWNCCGASSGHFLDDEISHALPARNLAIAEKKGLDTAIVCAACYLRLRATKLKAQESPEFRQLLRQRTEIHPNDFRILVEMTYGLVVVYCGIPCSAHGLYRYGLERRRIIELLSGKMGVGLDEYLDLFCYVQGLLFDHLLPQIVEGPDAFLGCN